MEESPLINQHEINQTVESTRKQLEEMINASGMSKAVFIATSKEASQLIGQYEIIRQEVIANGFEMPPLDESITVKLR